MASQGLLRAAAPHLARPALPLLPGRSLPAGVQLVSQSGCRLRRPRRDRGSLRCVAHGSHDHSHSHSHSHSHGHSHDASQSHDTGACCGHDHGHAPDPQNPAHLLLSSVYSATRLSAAAAWLESSLAATIGKVALFVLAAAATGWAGSAWAPSAAAASAARAVAAAATAGVYLLAGLPAALDLSYDVTAGRVDTHVLMNLAVLGTLATGHALEVTACNS